jgi:carbonic anhydrase/acetyltransferase-like protein (isoleucine patch superfamily)
MAVYELDGRRPDIAADGSVFIADTAAVIGNVRLGPEVSIWFGAVLRGDNELIDVGARSNIQDNCVLHTDLGFPLTIGEDCTIGHRAILHGCTIGRGTLIGMGAVILNGAVIGPGSVVGAGALVTEGKVFPECALLVGAPARVMRTLDEAWQEKLAASAAGYAANGRRFARGLTRI